MLNEKEIERFELLEKDLQQLRSEVEIQTWLFQDFLTLTSLIKNMITLFSTLPFAVS